MVLNELICHIKHYPYPDDITLAHTLEGEPSGDNCLCFLAGYRCREISFSLYLYLKEGRLMYYFFLDNDESDKEEQFLVLPGTARNYEPALDWIRSIAGQNNKEIEK